MLTDIPSLSPVALKSAIPAPISAIHLSLWLFANAPGVSAKPWLLCSIPCSSGSFALALSSPFVPSNAFATPQSSQPHSDSSAFPRRHPMRCRRGRGRGLPSRPPISPSTSRTVNLSVDWAEPDILDPINLSAHLSLHLPKSPSEAPGSGLRPKKRHCTSTIPPIPAFSPRKMVARPVQSALNSDHESSRLNKDGTNASDEALAASSISPNAHAALLPSTAHTSMQEDDEFEYACRIVEESFLPPKKDANSPST